MLSSRRGFFQSVVAGGVSALGVLLNGRCYVDHQPLRVPARGRVNVRDALFQDGHLVEVQPSYGGVLAPFVIGIDGRYHDPTVGRYWYFTANSVPIASSVADFYIDDGMIVDAYYVYDEGAGYQPQCNPCYRQW